MDFETRMVFPESIHTLSYTMQYPVVSLKEEGQDRYPPRAALNARRQCAFEGRDARSERRVRQ